MVRRFDNEETNRESRLLLMSEAGTHGDRQLDQCVNGSAVSVGGSRVKLRGQRQ